MLYLYHSNRLETLATQLAGEISRSGLDPFQQEQVVVQNAGMGRWLSLQLARETGIAANLRYLFPAEVTWEALRAVLEDVPERDPCSPKLLRWRLFEEFSRRGERYRRELGHYLTQDEDASAWQLAKQVAGVFDGYLFFRSDWIGRWEKQTNVEDWQQRLWLNVVKQPRLENWPRLQKRFMDSFDDFASNELPQRISFFSVPALSPAYIELVAKLAEKVDVYFYVMNPSWQYWGDIESRKQKIKRELPEQQYVTTGNPLLASWGAQGRDFIENLRNVEPYPQEFEDFELPPANSILHIVQADILNLEGEEAEGEAEPLPEANWQADQSIAVHACHSPMREVEVLFDQILAALQADPVLTPADIVVMSPEVETYAPFIEAVFGNASISLPFSIADQRFASARNVTAACLQFLEVPQGRFEAEAVFALLEYAEIRQAFRLDEAQVQQCRDWVREVNIRWGVDQAFRKQFAEQNTFEHTWVYGLDRLLLGYALPGGQLLGGILPYDHLEGSQAEVLERFLGFVQQLFPLANWSSDKKTIDEWCEQFGKLLGRFFTEDIDTRRLYQTLDMLREAVRQAEFEQAVDWSVFRDALRSQLEQSNQADGFLGSGITFCTLMPMRSVPFRFIALLGMQDSGFPRQDTRISFDKLAHDKRRRGDRSRRDEDRYLFLESLLSARQRLYISYVGQSVRDNSELTPSVLVSELLDYLEKRFAIDLQKFVVRHPLQAFSTRYFDGKNPSLFSYRSDLAELSANISEDDDTPFWEIEELAEPDDTFRQLSLGDLIRFYRQPARYFLKQRLDLVLHEQTEALEEREPFRLEAFVDSAMGQQIVQHLEYGHTSDYTQSVLRAQGLLPHGRPGEMLFEASYEQVGQLLAALTDQPEVQQFSHRQETTNVTLLAELDGVSKAGQQFLLLGYVGAWQWMDIWIRHLVLNACVDVPEDWSGDTRIYTPEGSYVLGAVAGASKQLERLLEGYWLGMKQPLPFFPKSAWVMMNAREPLLNKAFAEWEGTDRHIGERFKPEYALLYRGLAPLETQDKEFMAWSERVFGEMLRVRTELSPEKPLAAP